MTSLFQVQEALEICQYLEDSNQKRNPLCRNAPLCKDQLNDNVISKGYQVLEMMDLIPFPHNLCTGIILHHVSSNSVCVFISGTFNWCQRTTPNLWDRAINWNGQGLVAQSFVDSASAICDTIHRALRIVPVTLQRQFKMIGFGLGSPIIYLLSQILSPLAKDLGFQNDSTLLFACPKFVNSSFQLGFRPRAHVVSYALQEDVLPRMPVSPLNWQWTWPVIPIQLDQNTPLAEDPPNPAQTKSLLPRDYLKRLQN